MARMEIGKHRDSTARSTVCYEGIREVAYDSATWKSVVLGGRLAVSRAAYIVLLLSVAPQNATTNVCLYETSGELQCPELPLIAPDNSH